MLQFGIGDAFAVPNGGNLATPSYPQRFLILQDVNVDLDQKLVELRGQNKFPDDVAPSDMSCKGKAGWAQVEVDIYNALFFGDTVTASSAKVMVSDEAGTGATVTVTGSATWFEDVGVRYADGSGFLRQVASAPTVGQYTVAAGVYTFTGGDTSKPMLISYIKTAAVGKTLTVTNRIQGYGPTFELWLRQPYQGNNGMHLFMCRASKMGAPMKRDGYMISDFEFQAFANAAGNVLEWYQTTTF